MLHLNMKKSLVFVNRRRLQCVRGGELLETVAGGGSISSSNNKKSSNCSPSWKSYMKKNQKFFTHFVVTSVIILRHSSYIRELNQKGYNYQSSSSSSLALSCPSRGGGNNKLGGTLDLSSSRDSKMGLDLSCSSQYSRVSAAAVVDVVLELLVMIAAVLRGQVLAAECLSMVATMLHRRQIEGGKKKLSTLFSELSMIPLLAGVFIRGGVEGW